MLPQRDPGSFDDFGTDRLGVFVPGVIGAGLLMSLGIMIADAFRGLTGNRGSRRRQLLGAHATAEAVLTGHRRDVDEFGLRPRAAYVLVALAATGIGGYGVAFSFWNYVLKDHMWSAIGWILALSAVAATALLWIGIAAAGVALRWPYVPAFAWPLMLRTPLGKVPPQGRGPTIKSPPVA